MNIRCPECATVFRVDPARIPPAGVRARCSRCSASFRITPDGLGETRPPVTAGDHAAGAATGPASAAQTSAAPPAASSPVAPPTPPTAPSSATAGTTPSGAASGAAPGSAAPGAQPAETPRTPVFGSRDPNARAQRIARALVSDIVAYHPEKREHCMATGTLRSGFRDEIMKSWEEYVAQVGLDMAKTTPYFREALNNILAGGQQVF